MSEAPSHSHEPNPSITVRPEGVSDSLSPPVSDVPTLEAPQLYRPLSLLAVFSLVLGVAYALLILVGGWMPLARTWPRGFWVLLLLGPVLGGLATVLLRQKKAGGLASGPIATIAGLALAADLVLMGLVGLIFFSGSSPWEPGSWTWLLLFAALLVSVLALAQIRSAEGALAGRNLARSGLYLSIGFGAFYVLYLAANQFAVSNQAQSTADRFLEHVQQDRLPQAFYETLPPGSRPNPQGDLRGEIEEGFNAARGFDQGEYSSFCTSLLVQGFRQGGKSRVTCNGVAPELTQTGYVAQVRYRVVNDLGSYEILISLQSVEVAGQRQWQVALSGCRTIPPDDSPQMQNLILAARETEVFANRWLADLSARHTEGAYLMTLPPEQRLPLGRALLIGRPETSALAGFPASMGLRGLEKDHARLVAGTKDFVENKGKYAGFVDDRDFVTDPKTKEARKKEVIAFFSHSNRAFVNAEMLRVDFPDAQRDGDEIQVGRPVRFVIEPSDENPHRTYVEGEILCRGKVGPEPLQDRYRVVGLKLIRAAIAPVGSLPRGRGA